MGRLLDRFIHRKALEFWRNAADHAPEAPLRSLREQGLQARELRKTLDRLTQTAEGRLLRPRLGSNLFQNPQGTDWSWRPLAWRGPLANPGLASVQNKTMLDGSLQVFHDSPSAELILRQLRNRNQKDLAPFGLRMEVFNFGGSFLSLAINLPPEALAGLTRQHVIRLSGIVEIEKPTQIFARLNIEHGPNTDQLLSSLSQGADNTLSEFDLSLSDLNEKRLEKAWVDLIFDAPDMNQFALRDISFSRHLRANF